MQPPPPLRHLILMGGSVRAAAESAASDGWEVSAIDRFGDVDTRRAARSWQPLPPELDFDGLLERLPPGPLVLTGGMEQWYQRLERVRDQRPVLAPPTATIERLRDPVFLQSLAERCGFRFPRFRLPTTREVPPGWLAKSRRSTAGLGVSASRINPRNDDHYLQKRVAGRPWGASFLASDSSTELLGVCRSLFQNLGATPFLYSGSLGPLPVRTECQQKLQRLGEAIRQELALRGLFGIDLIADSSDELWVLEINPRMTASMELLERRLGSSLVTRHVAAHGVVREQREAHGDASSSHLADATLGLKRIVWSRAACRWDPEWELTTVGTLVTLHDIPQPGTSIERHTPLVSLGVRGQSVRNFLRAAHEVESRLHKKCQPT
ncbi:ATP-grasp domain-containing protein [Candidatus Laterigemmans baculatus]|uniref:ATP-grasp domain-containing protein n=1 Tax=Candidatus Laterigemmans baculatus TaxID=2770505 RepID=UPI0013DCF6A3|nr:ATP-grasp domain-containing protein [Candidatus Laterigemmans baculatus]